MQKQIEGKIEEIHRWNFNPTDSAAFAYNPMSMSEAMPHSSIKVNNEIFDMDELDLEDLKVGDKVRITITTPTHDMSKWYSKMVPKMWWSLVDSLNTDQKVEKIQ